jgi:hypothetical protein
MAADRIIDTTGDNTDSRWRAVMDDWESALRWLDQMDDDLQRLGGAALAEEVVAEKVLALTAAVSVSLADAAPAALVHEWTRRHPD